MTVLHSSNADVADVSNLDEATAQDGTTETPDPRADLGRYAELGAFTLTADTHAWYGAVDTVATPEDARAASTVLAELRGRDLQQTWQAVTGLAGEAGLEEPSTIARAALLVELLQRVHRTYATLDGAAYDADLDALAAATAGGAWRKERGVKLSWIRAMGLRKQAQTLAVARRIRREELHEALAAAEVERRTWAVLAPEGTRPVAPSDGDLVDATAQAFEAINAGLTELARLLPGHDLETLTIQELGDLVERLADDEGTLYRLPTLRSLRAGLEEAGLAELLTELADARADRRAAEAAYQRHTGGADAARQALAGGQRDGQSDPKSDAPEEAEAAEVAEAEAAVEADVADVADVAEAEVTEAVEAVAEVVVSIPAPSSEDENLAAAEAAEAAEAAVEPEAVEVAEPEVASAVEAEVEAEPEAEAEAVPEAEVAPEAEVVEPVAEVVVEVAEPEVVVAEAVVAEPELSEPAVEAELAEAEVTVAQVTVTEVAEVVEVAKAEPEAEPEPEAKTVPAARSRRPKKPDFTPGKPVTAYSAEELLAVVRWIDGDAVERTEEELLRAAMKEFGFARLGPRIKEALGAAVSQARG